MSTQHRVIPSLTLIAVGLLLSGCSPSVEESSRTPSVEESSRAPSTQEGSRSPSAEENGRGITITKTADGYLFSEGADSVMLYHAEPVQPERDHARSHYVHPLFGLDGTVLTEDFPEDHPHQHGLYWAWHQIYVAGRRVGDGWEQEDVEWDVRNVDVLEDDVSPALKARAVWHSPRFRNGAEPFIEETATLRAYPAAEGYREIDVTVELRALVDDVRIGGSEDEKGYGGLSLRVRLPEDVRFGGPDGRVQPEETAVEAGPWVDVSATYAADGLSGVTILQHPSNPRYPQTWILRSEASMQNPKWPGEEPAVIPTDEPVTLRYRLVVHEGAGDALFLNDLHGRYAHE